MSKARQEGFFGRLIGPKRRWWAYRARIRGLPAPYRAAAEAVERYLMHFGPLDASDAESLLEDVADLFERAAADGTSIRELGGDDPVEVVEALIRNYAKGGYVDRERKRLADAFAGVPGAWSGMVPVDDTELWVSDTGGSGTPVLYLNGAYADTSHWRHVIAELGGDCRHITYDERARGRSKRSADYSFEGMLRDVDAVLVHRGVDRVLLVGWSLGGVLAWSWTGRHPERVLGTVIVDAFPVGRTGPEGHEEIRRLFRGWRLVLPLAAWVGLAARMTADQHADVNIECNEIADASGPVLEGIRRPTWFVLATGDSLGTSGGEMDRGRAALEPLLARNPNLRIAAQVESNHTAILRRDSSAVARAVRELAVSVGAGRADG